MGGQPVDTSSVPTQRGAAGFRLGVVLLVAASTLSCKGPLDDILGMPPVDPYIGRAVDRELATVEADTPTLMTTQPPGEVEQTLAPRRAELEAIAPATPTNQTPFSLGDDLTGNNQQVVEIDLATAAATAVTNNLSVRVARVEPAINREDVINADAAFDFVLFAGADLEKIDQPQPAVAIEGNLIGTPFNASETYRFETGVSKRLYSGGEVFVSTDLRRFRSNSPGTQFVPDPAYIAAIRAGITQPLLRGFGEDVNTATIRLAANAERRATEQLTTELLVLLENVEILYWDLALTWLELEIQQWLVDVGDQVRQNLGDRLDFDTKPAEYSDAVATVERRKADVIRARRRLRERSDSLKLLLNDPELTVGSEAVLRTTDPFVTTPLDYNLRDAVVTAVNMRPEVRQAFLVIADTNIGITVTRNGLLPLLNLDAEIAYWGMDDNAGEAYSNVFDIDFIDYILGLSFEYPIGNRAAEADFRRARLERAQALLAYQQTVQEVVLDVKESLRNVVTTYELIQATRSFRVAQAENLRTLEAEEPLRGLTPEFLNLKFQRQEGLALARRDELQAIVNFDQSVAALYRSMGTGLERRGIDIESAGRPEDLVLED